MERYNMVVIGGGAAGLTAAAGAALVGARVALLGQAGMGGECLNTGCVPSKALLHVARVAQTVRSASAHAVSAPLLPTQDMRSVMQYVRAVQARIAPHDSAARFTRLGVRVVASRARLRSPHEVEAVATGEVLWARHIVIATGSEPLVPAIPGLAEASFLTNETVWDLEALPASLLVIGGGPIGCELGQAFQRLGSRVTIVNRAAHVLAREDADVAEVLERRLAREGVTVWNGSSVQSVQSVERPGRTRVRIASPSGGRELEVDAVLVAAGRRPRVRDLGLEAAGVAFGDRGIGVTRGGRTNVRSVWAAGDVTDTFRFTHWGGHQARLVVRNALLPGSSGDDRRALPWATFTEPEVARVGLSETEAKASGVACDVYRVPFEEVDRAVCDGTAEGFAKVLARRGSGRILGAAIVHPHAGELIGEPTLAIKRGLTLSQLGGVIHVYPTLGDVHRALADERFLGAVLPRVAPLLRRVFSWLR
jgi:pyruvate/2-oxoglutarate dehydrogenase complex dihydrolipoamide dehydrogenase (E3) component